MTTGKSQAKKIARANIETKSNDFFMGVNLPLVMVQAEVEEEAEVEAEVEGVQYPWAEGVQYPWVEGVGSPSVLDLSV